MAFAILQNEGFGFREMFARGLAAAWLTMTMAGSQSFAQGPGNCESLATALDNQVITSDQIVPVATWSMAKGDLQLSPEQILPSKYVQSLAEKFNFDLKVKPIVDQKTISVALSIGSKDTAYPSATEVITFKLQEDTVDRVLVDNLVLEDPLNESISNLKDSQLGKGLDQATFRFAKHQLFEIARSAGYKKIYTKSQQNFLVLMLYRRSVGMTPANQITARYLEMFDRYYRLARRDLDQSITPKNVHQFSKILGSVWHAPFSQSMQAAWSRFRRFGSATPGYEFTPVNDPKNGERVGVIVKMSNGEEQFVFINKLDPKEPLLAWGDLAKAKIIELEMELPRPQ